MGIAVTCHCGNEMNIHEDFGGKPTVCPRCRRVVQVPERQDPKPDAGDEKRE